MQKGFICMVRDVPGAEKPEQTCGVLQLSDDGRVLLIMKVGERHKLHWVPFDPLTVLCPIPQQMDEEETKDNEKSRVLSDLGKDESKDE